MMHAYLHTRSKAKNIEHSIVCRRSSVARTLPFQVWCNKFPAMMHKLIYIWCDVPDLLRADMPVISVYLYDAESGKWHQLTQSALTNEQRMASRSPKDLFPSMRGHEDGYPAQGGRRVPSCTADLRPNNTQNLVMGKSSGALKPPPCPSGPE